MGIQILIPHNKHKQFMVSTTIPAFFSIACNLVLIPYLGYIGAAITSVLTESVVWFIQLYYAREVMKELTILPHVIKVALATAVMSGILVVVKSWIHFTPMLNVMILAVIGMLVYGIIVIGFKIIKIKEIKNLLKHSWFSEWSIEKALSTKRECFLRTYYLAKPTAFSILRRVLEATAFAFLAPSSKISSNCLEFSNS